MLNCIKKRKLSKIACDEENIVKDCLSNNVNLEDSDIKKILAQLSQENLISKRSKSGKIIFTPINSNSDSTTKITVHDIQNNDITTDFEDFKLSIMGSLAKLNTEVESLKNISEEPEQNHLATENIKLNYLLESKETIIGILRDEIKHLREENKNLFGVIRQNQSGVSGLNFSHITEPLIKQLDDKQSTIDKLLPSHKEQVKRTNEPQQSDRNKNLNHDTSQLQNQRDEFIIPKRFAKKREDLNSFNVQTRNRYEYLKENDNIDDNNQTEINVGRVNSKEIPNNNQKRKGNRKSSKPSVTILGDSLLKDVKSFEMNKAANHDVNIYVKSFPGASVEDMASYVIPTKKHNPNIAILHCGTNDLSKSEEPRLIANNIVKLAKSMHTNNSTIVVSALVPRKDGFDRMRIEVNNHLKKECNESNLGYIDHENIDKSKHLNRSGLHLNTTGTGILTFNLLSFICNILD